MKPTPGRGGPRDHRPPMTVEVDHAIVVSLRPVARQRDVPVARLPNQNRRYMMKTLLMAILLAASVVTPRSASAWWVSWGAASGYMSTYDTYCGGLPPVAKMFVVAANSIYERSELTTWIETAERDTNSWHSRTAWCSDIRSRVDEIEEGFKEDSLEDMKKRALSDKNAASVATPSEKNNEPPVVTPSAALKWPENWLAANSDYVERARSENRVLGELHRSARCF
jgi:hypothetical protein